MLKGVLRALAAIALFAVWAITFLWLYTLGTSYLFMQWLVNPEWGWPLAIVAVLTCLLTYTFALNRILSRLDR